MTKKLLIAIALRSSTGCGDTDVQLAPAHPGANACALPSDPGFDEPAMYGDPSLWQNGRPFFAPQPLRIACLPWRFR